MSTLLFIALIMFTGSFLFAGLQFRRAALGRRRTRLTSEMLGRFVRWHMRRQVAARKKLNAQAKESHIKVPEPPPAKSDKSEPIPDTLLLTPPHAIDVGDYQPPRRRIRGGLARGVRRFSTAAQTAADKVRPDTDQEVAS